MYKALRFDSLYDLTDFLNENEIEPNKIIGIYRAPISPNAGVYDLLYYVEDKRKTDEEIKLGIDLGDEPCHVVFDSMTESKEGESND